MLSTEVAVVGAGPAGTAAAISLARAGHDVTMVDKATFPRDKICGDGLTTGALRLLDGLGLRPGAVASWQRVDDVVVRSPSGHEATFPMPRDRGTYAAVARRVDLDAALVDLARARGVKVLDGHACTGVTEGGDAVTVEVEGEGPLRARWLVAADGMWSPVRKALGLATPGYRGEWHAFRQYFTGVGPRAQRELFVWFEPDLLPGYAWSFPRPDHLAVGICAPAAHHTPSSRLRAQSATWIERHGMSRSARLEPYAWPIPTIGFQRRRDVVLGGPGRKLLGDAAGLVDPLTREGIYYALLSGHGSQCPYSRDFSEVGRRIALGGYRARARSSGTPGSGRRPADKPFQRDAQPQISTQVRGSRDRGLEA